MNATTTCSIRAANVPRWVASHRKGQDRRWLACLAAVLAIIACSSTAEADPNQAHTSQGAPYVYRETFVLSAGASITWETTNLSPGTDTVLHVWKCSPSCLYNAGPEVAFNDDRLPGDYSSYLVYTNPGPGTNTYLLVLRSFATTSQGTATLKRNGIAVGTIGVAGNRLPVPSEASYVYESVLTTNGTPDTVLFGLNWQGRLLAIDDDYGVG